MLNIHVTRGGAYIQRGCAHYGGIDAETAYALQEYTRLKGAHVIRIYILERVCTLSGLSSVEPEIEPEFDAIACEQSCWNTPNTLPNWVWTYFTTPVDQSVNIYW